MSRLTTIIKQVLPDPMVQAIRSYRGRTRLRQFAGLSTEQVFTKIYEEGAWGSADEAEQVFFSGSGSRADAIVETYVDEVGRFLRSLGHKPDVVDLGCGDFFVGSRLRPLCARYVACDIVAPLIAFNAEKYKALDVDFRTLDLTRDELPSGEVVFLRQVFQHLSNGEIARALPALQRRYRYMVLTEHVPNGAFAHNLDKACGPDSRMDIHSGVVLTSPPFNLASGEASTLCQMAEWGGLVRTVLYRLH
ncbi:class I SAM-dependent methyltransferase [Variovorax sp. GT1P44]|uniref:class I SAM-dependent methyltransferase n=1 Tax=Variovorax sp. GT1P44 TaxID=3443742 RepID=UPI003F4563BC